MQISGSTVSVRPAASEQRTQTAAVWNAAVQRGLRPAVCKGPNASLGRKGREAALE